MAAISSIGIGIFLGIFAVHVAAWYHDQYPPFPDVSNFPLTSVAVATAVILVSFRPLLVKPSLVITAIGTCLLGTSLVMTAFPAPSPVAAAGALFGGTAVMPIHEAARLRGVRRYTKVVPVLIVIVVVTLGSIVGFSPNERDDAGTRNVPSARFASVSQLADALKSLGLGCSPIKRADPKEVGQFGAGVQAAVCEVSVSPSEDSSPVVLLVAAGAGPLTPTPEGINGSNWAVGTASRRDALAEIITAKYGGTVTWEPSDF
jgi:hypothetical protein